MSDPRYVIREVKLKELYRYSDYSLVELPSGEYDIVFQNGNSTGLNAGDIAATRMTANIAVKMAVALAIKLANIEKAQRGEAGS